MEKSKKYLNKLKKGDKAAFKALFDEYSGLFNGIAFRYTSDYEKSNDVTQEAFIKIHKNIKSYKGIGNFEGWMKRIVVNCCLDYVRKEKRFAFEQEDEVLEYESDWHDAVSSMTFEEIVSVVETLPIGYKTIFNLNVFEGYSHKEIAESLNISESASRSQLTKAKASLRKKLVVLGVERA